MMNSSSSHNNSFLQSNISSNLFQPQDLDCYMSGLSSVIFTTCNMINIFLLAPVCFAVLYHGFQKQRQMSFTFIAATASHCDCFTYHNVTMDMIGIFGCVLCICATYMKDSYVFTIGRCMFCLTWYGEIFLHILTCLERYLAVVHPITYMGLRNKKGIRIRNITTACVWGLSFLFACWVTAAKVVIVDLCFLVSTLTVISFCSISVLHALVHPGPGEQDGSRKKVGQFKHRAFFTILSILGALLLRLASNVIFELLYISTGHIDCAVITSILFFNLPSSLMLPLLYLSKERKLVLNRMIAK